MVSLWLKDLDDEEVDVELGTLVTGGATHSEPLGHTGHGFGVGVGVGVGFGVVLGLLL